MLNLAFLRPIMPRFLIALLLFAGGLFSASPASAQSPGGDFEINSIILSRNCPLPDGPDLTLKSPEAILQANEDPECPKFDDMQLIQVTLTNLGARTRSVGLEIRVTLDDQDLKAKSFRKVFTIPSFDLARLLHDIKLDQPGLYKISARVWDTEFKRLYDQTREGEERKFYVASAQDVEEAMETLASGGRKGKRRPIPLQFDPPDLRWESVQVIPKHVLRGEVLRIRLNLVNVGGDIVRGIKSKVEYFNSRQPRRRSAIAFPETAVAAPGEVVTYELDFMLPEDQLLGEYKIVAEADPDNMIEELKEGNNVIESGLIRLSDIKLLLPADEYVFEEAGLFLLQWDSLAYGEFKVQVGVDEKFEDSGMFFDLPQGDRWIADKELVPLSGELPGMGLGLMQATGKNRLYWRVIGRQASGRQSFSAVRSFTIKPSR